MMRAMIWFDLFVLCYHPLAVASLAHKVNIGNVNLQQETSWQQAQGQITKMESLLTLQQHSPVIGLKRRQESTFSLDKGLSNTKEETQNAVQIDNTEPNMILADIEDCQPLPRLRARGGKDEQAPPPVPNLKCSLPAITGTDTSQSGQQQQSATTGDGDDGGDEREDGQAPSGTKDEQPIILPQLFRIPMNDGDNPTCYDATYGLMPVGVCQNPQLTPQPSKYDVFMNRNIEIYARAWKLIDSQPAWPGMRECLPSQKDNGIWCCRFYSYLFLWGDVCWPLVTIEHLNSRGIGYWQRHQFTNPLILPP